MKCLSYTPYEYLYLIADPMSMAVKIGRSQDPRARLDQLQTSNPHPLLLYHIFPFMGFSEMGIHKTLQKMHPDLHIQGEWYKLTETLVDKVFDYVYHDFCIFMQEQYFCMDVGVPEEASEALDILWEYMVSCPQLKAPGKKEG